ncbi:MAG: DinB family protein [Actinomycetota bacterium]
MTGPSEVLRDGFAHHLWATRRLLDALDALGEEELDAEIPGTYGSIARTITHLIDADDRYLQRLAVADVPPYVDHGGQPVAVLRERLAEHEERWAAMLGALEEGTLLSRVDRGEDGIVDPAESLLLLQALHHGDDHRTQVCSTLGASGLDVPELDVWSFWAAERA